MSTPTPEQFLAQPSDPDEDVEEATPADPLTSIAESLRTLVDKVVQHEEAVKQEDRLQQEIDQLDREYSELEDRLNAVRALIKPSTSKLANSIREVLNPKPQPFSEDAEGNVDDSITEPHAYVDTAASLCALCEQPAGYELHTIPQPADDAPVEAWRAFGASRGLDLTDNLNRSQIRSALGIPQPVAS